MRAMLKQNGPPPQHKWADLAVFEPVREYKARHASTLLTFDAVVAALDLAEATCFVRSALSQPDRPLRETLRLFASDHSIEI